MTTLSKPKLEPMYCVRGDITRFLSTFYKNLDIIYIVNTIIANRERGVTYPELMHSTALDNIILQTRIRELIMDCVIFSEGDPKETLSGGLKYYPTKMTILLFDTFIDVANSLNCKELWRNSDRQDPFNGT